MQQQIKTVKVCCIFNHVRKIGKGSIAGGDVPSARNGRGSLTSHNASTKGMVSQREVYVNREGENITTIHNLTEAHLEAMYESPGIPVKSMLADEDGAGKTVWGIGDIKKRSASYRHGSSSDHSGMRRSNGSRSTSESIIYTSEGKSQGKKSEIQIAFERAQNDL